MMNMGSFYISVSSWDFSLLDWKVFVYPETDAQWFFLVTDPIILHALRKIEYKKHTQRLSHQTQSI